MDDLAKFKIKLVYRRRFSIQTKLFLPCVDISHILFILCKPRNEENVVQEESLLAVDTVLHLYDLLQCFSFDLSISDAFTSLFLLSNYFKLHLRDAGGCSVHHLQLSLGPCLD